MKLFIQKPCKRSVQIILDEKNDWTIRRRYFLPFPYIVYLWDENSEGSIGVFFANEFPDINTKLGLLPFSNSVVRYGSRFCLGNTYDDPKKAIAAFWQSVFESHKVSRGRTPFVFRKWFSNIVNYKKWEKFSVEDILKVKWKPCSYKFYDLRCNAESCDNLTLEGNQSVKKPSLQTENS